MLSKPFYCRWTRYRCCAHPNWSELFHKIKIKLRLCCRQIRTLRFIDRMTQRWTWVHIFGPNPTRGLTQPMSISGMTYYGSGKEGRLFVAAFCGSDREQLQTCVRRRVMFCLERQWLSRLVCFRPEARNGLRDMVAVVVTANDRQINSKMLAPTA